MSTTVPNSQFPLPVSEAYEPDDLDAARDGSVIAMWGHCQPWCETDCGDARRDGHTVYDHGPYCMSLMIGNLIEAAEDDGQPLLGVVTLARSYMQGMYAVPLPSSCRTTFVRLDFSVMDETRLAANLTSSEARTLAASLLRGADEADGLTTPLRRHAR
ncbi:hypothetical protein [Allobranchiibius sp. GilTou38]|uniref:hypothetical protein n=1 Tax=Allobranchiibius sp. GilTou38 TaxID=2815210 RepID=UPI001AA0C472|nr:hypothetical protein [Allobranchiibius sp. GilTou38]MBO1766789.1 hypothetical protein [Allobranchiibius sp. GilTou38]